MEPAGEPPDKQRDIIEKIIAPIDRAELESSEAGHKTALICRSVEEIKGQNITILDVRGLTIIADFFVLCTGTSTTHIHSIAGNVLDELREKGFRTRAEGQAASCWIVLDYGDTILHVLNDETREFYDLERLWADAKIYQWSNEQSES